jgi:hypothetical protein
MYEVVAVTNRHRKDRVRFAWCLPDDMEARGEPGEVQKGNRTTLSACLRVDAQDLSGRQQQKTLGRAHAISGNSSR